MFLTHPLNSSFARWDENYLQFEADTARKAFGKVLWSKPKNKGSPSEGEYRERSPFNSLIQIYDWSHLWYCEYWNLKEEQLFIFFRGKMCEKCKGLRPLQQCNSGLVSDASLFGLKKLRSPWFMSLIHKVNSWCIPYGAFRFQDR